MRTRTIVVSLMTMLLLWSISAAAVTDQKGTLVVALDTLGAQTMDPILERRAPQAHYQAPISTPSCGLIPSRGHRSRGRGTWEMAEDGKSWIFYIRQRATLAQWRPGDRP